MSTPMGNAGPTVYPAVNTLLAELVREIRVILGPKLVGVYLYGSLSLGDFDPASSDVDFLAVTRDTLTSGVFTALSAMHTRLGTSTVPYADKLEGWYFTRAALRHPALDEPQQATIGADWPFEWQIPGPVWVIERHIVREHGLTVFGPPPRELIDPVAPEALRAATRTLLRDFWALQLDGPDWLRTRDYQAFAILTMCRALHTLHTGQVVSKPVAAAWAQQYLPPPWPALITQALGWRHDHREADMTAMLAFIRWTVAQAQ
ncbi:MAG TPA: aminoglycoside adenylyltransferase domain-containing protein [Thermomicrobiales bacterium]|jgi:hypothetical protein